MLNVMFGVTLALVATGGPLMCGEPGPIRKAVAIVLLFASLLAGLTTAVLEPMG